MTIYTLFMVTNYKSIYQPRTEYADWSMKVYSISDITIQPDEKVDIPLGISLQLNDNRTGEQAPFFITPEETLLQQGIIYEQNPIYIYNKANYYKPSITVTNKSKNTIIIPSYSSVGIITNNVIFDLIIM